MTHFSLAALGLLVSGAASLAVASLLGGARWGAVAVVPLVWFGLLWVARQSHRWWVRGRVRKERDERYAPETLRALAIAARAQAVAAGESGFTRDVGPLPALERAVLLPWGSADESAVVGELVASSLASRQALVQGLRDLHDEAIQALSSPLHPLFPEAPQLLKLVGHPVPVLFSRSRAEAAWRERRPHVDPSEPDVAIAIRLLGAGLPDAALVALPIDSESDLVQRLRTLGRLLSLVRRGESGALSFKPEEFAAWAPELMLLAGRKVRELMPGSAFIDAVEGGAAFLERAVARMPETVNGLLALRREMPELDDGIVLIVGRLLQRPERVVRSQIETSTLVAHPDRTLQTHLRGVALLAEGRPREALGEFEAVLEREPGYHPSAYAMALGWARLGDHQRAEAFLRTALERDADDPDLHLALCRFLSSVQDEDGAREAFEAALHRFPRSVALRIAYAQQLARWGAEPEAREHLDHALDLNPKDPRLAFMAGRARVAVGDARDALEPLELATRELHGRGRAEALFWLLWALREQGDHDRAMGLADRVLLGLGSGQEGLLGELADYFEERHDFRRARTATDRARRLRGGFDG